METGSIATQELYYANLSATQADKPAWFNDPALEDANNKVAKLKNDGVSQKIGPAILLKVMAGDSYNIRVVSGWNSGSTPTQGTNDIATLLLNALSGGLVQQGVKATATELQNGSSGLSNAITDFLNSQPSPGARPKAYINWVMLDEQFKYAGGGADPVGISGVSTVHTKTNLTVPKNGYLYIYTSNESNNIDVFFDNLQVTHTAGHILEETHYYPFGLVMAGISSRALNNIAPNNYKFNAGTELNSVFDLHYYETPLRNFDPQVGRFNCIDILAEKTYGINPYHFGNNCPVMLNDPTGALMEAGTGRAEKGPDGEYHVGWVSEMMWEYPTSFSFGSGKTEGGDFSTYWNYIINANFGDGVDLPTSIIANIPGFGESYFGNVNGAWGFFNSATNAGYTGNNSEINALSSLLTSFAKNGNSEISGRFFEMLGGNISHNIYTDRNQISTLNGIERDGMPFHFFPIRKFFCDVLKNKQ